MISNEAEVKCPFNDKYACQAAISEREIRAVSRYCSQHTFTRKQRLVLFVFSGCKVFRLSKN